MLKLNTKTVLTDPRTKNPLNSDGKDLRACDVLANVLLGATSNPARSYVLAKKILDNDEVELKAEDIVFVKAEIERVANPNLQMPLSAVTAGQLIEMLDGSVPETTSKKAK